jgi:adenylosuccinate synthase
VAAQARLRVRHDHGRPRRVGWYDAPITRYATRINGITDLSPSSTSSPDSDPRVRRYDVDGERFDEVPVNQSDFHHAKPIFEYFPGWQDDISGARSFEDLPVPGYVLALEAMSGTRISVIGVGPARDAVIVRHDLVD